jgi:hypothetical protein
MKFKNWTQVGWILTSLLLLSIGVISYSRESRSTRPTIDNYGPSGTAAFATLLSKNGYQIRNLTSTFPEVDPEDTIVAFVQNSEFDSGQSPAVFQYFNELAERGNRDLILP